MNNNARSDLQRIVQLSMAAAIMLTPTALAEKNEKPYSITLAPVFEYIDLRQPMSDVPREPHDTGWLYGLQARGEWSPFRDNDLVFSAGIKHTWSLNVEYEGTREDEDPVTGAALLVADTGVTSNYKLLDIDATIGYEFSTSPDTTLTPHVGYKHWRWDNVLAPDAEAIHEVSTLQGFVAGAKFQQDLSGDNSAYVNASFVFPTSVDIEFRNPSFPTEDLKKKTSYNIALGYNFNRYFVEAKYSRYETGQGFASAPAADGTEIGDSIKSPVEIDLFGVSGGVRF